jgi:hypothetical protein
VARCVAAEVPADFPGPWERHTPPPYLWLGRGLPDAAMARYLP